MNTEATTTRHSAWVIWQNPIFRRYCRSRLRSRGLGVWLLIVVLIAGFMVAMANSIGIRLDANPRDSARGGLIPLLFLQGIILFILGTAQVAGGMVAERDEGVIDYQRLVPMSPLAKVLGYVFGLPVREYVLFAATLPFTAWSLWRGQVDWHVWLPLYGAVLSSTLLYHFTGLLTGTVVRNRRWAFLISVGLVFALYTVIPQMARFGLVFFKYLSVTPVYLESLPGLLPETASSAMRAVNRLAPVVKFFNLNLSEIVFTLFSQAGLILTFVIMLCRKWRQSESHLLGKIWAGGFFVWIQVLLLGNALPLIDPGTLFPSRGLYQFMMNFQFGPPRPEEALLMSGVYGGVTLALIFILGGMITPSLDNQLRGLRRAKKQGAAALPWLADSATSFWAVVIMAIAGACGWFIFTRALVESRWYPGHVVPMKTLWYFLAVMFTGGVGFQALLEAKGGRALGMATIFIGVVPIMVGAVLASLSDRFAAASAWLAGIAPVAMPFYAAGSLLSISELPFQVARAIPRAFHFFLFVGLLVVLWLIKTLYANRRMMAKEVLAAPTAN
jgi:hypothetical protein